MDELEISGKRYISSRRAGREHRYHPDYIGQLIRGGKVPGQKVGRAWYVDAEALKAYFNGESLVVSPKQEEAVAVVVHAEEPASIPHEPELAPQPQPIEAPAVAQPVTPTATPVASTFVPEPVSSVEDDEEISVPIKGLQYIADDTELLPRVSKPAPVADHVYAAPVYTPTLTPRPTRNISIATIALAGILTVAVVGALCSQLIEQTIVSQSQQTQSSIQLAN